MATYTFDVCFNEYKCKEAGIKNLDKIMKPLYEKWGAEWYASETGPFGVGSKPEDVERIIAVENVPEKYMKKIMLYFDDKSYARLDGISKRLAGSPEDCTDECGMYTSECERCKMRYYFFEGLPKNPTDVDCSIFDKYENDHLHFKNKVESGKGLSCSPEEMKQYLKNKYT